jgi:malate dehydrogenase (oxaloacetate-decarboxylating)(NADP+)
MTLSGLYSALRMISRKLTEQRLVFLGAGGAALGIGSLVISAMVEEGLTASEARSRCWFVDSKGLVVTSRTDLEHKRRFAQDYPPHRSLLSVVEAVKPTVMIGAAGQPGAFTPSVLAAMARINKRPIVFALSNPTSQSECTAEEAYRYTDKRAIFASGSPFEPVVIDGQTFVPGQANNSYIFPGVGLGILASEATRVTDEMFAAAAKALDRQVSDADFNLGRIYPSQTRIRDVSKNIALAVASVAYAKGLTALLKPSDLQGLIESKMYDPTYAEIIIPSTRRSKGSS